MGDKQFEFDRRLIAKQDDLVTTNHGSDESSATVAHLRKTGDKLYELTYDQVSRHYGSTKLTRKNLFNDRDQGLIKRDTGRGETPGWLHAVAPALPWKKNSFVYELDHLHMDNFFAREIRDRSGYEYVFTLDRKRSGRFEASTTAFIHVPPPGQDMDVPVEAETGDIVVDIVEDAGQREIDVEFKLPVKLGGEAAAGVQEIVSGVCLKHGYIGETVEFELVEQDGEWAKLFFPSKGFILSIDLSGDGLDTGVPTWVRALLREDGCPIKLDTEDVDGVER